MWDTETPTVRPSQKRPPKDSKTHTYTLQRHFTHPPDDLITLKNHNFIELCISELQLRYPEAPSLKEAKAGGVLYLRQDVGALLQQRDRRLAQAGGELHPEQLLLLGQVVLQCVSQSHGRTPVR